MLATADIASKFNYYVEGGKGNITKKALHNDSIGTDGVVIFTLSLIPFKKKPTRFDVSGIGHYDIIHKRSHEVFFTSTFRFTECMNCDPIENLIKKINEKDTTSLKLKFTQVAINQFDYYTAADIEADGLKGIKYSHVPAEPIEVHINLKMRDEYGSKCFSINYDFKHPVRFQGIPIGTLSITPPKDIGSRIIDLKNMNLLIRKYKKAP